MDLAVRANSDLADTIIEAEAQYRARHPKSRPATEPAPARLQVTIRLPRAERGQHVEPTGAVRVVAFVWG